jgi:site-specific DNA recombinase
MFNALKLERELSDEGILLFATDEPVDIAGTNPNTILVRRIKQGVAEWYRLNLKKACWRGLRQHTMDGWNIGAVPYGYLGEKVPHPVPLKAAQGRTKTRLTLDPVRAPVVAVIFTWRVTDKLGIFTIANRLNADPAAYPPPSAGGWTEATVAAILSNPKYTGYMVLGRRRRRKGKLVKVPQGEWIWSPRPTHPAIIDLDVWQQAQSIGAERGNVQDEEMITTRRGRYYILRSRVYCRACTRRMGGTTRTTPQTRTRPSTSITTARTTPKAPATLPPAPTTPPASLSAKTPSCESSAPSSSPAACSAPTAPRCSPPPSPVTPARPPAGTSRPPPCAPSCAGSTPPRPA